MYSKLIQNHVLANLTFLLVLALGIWSYASMPRQQDPSINFNWIMVTTVLPGASAGDVEKQVTDPLEDSIRTLSDLKFVSSNSREGLSSILVRFNDMDERTFDKRIADLRREVQNTETLLPDEASDAFILELTSSTAFPAAMVVVRSLAEDEGLRAAAQKAEKDIEQFDRVDRVDTTALNDPEIQVRFDSEALEALNLAPHQLADTARIWMKDIAAGTQNVAGHSWLVRLAGKTADPYEIAQMPIPGLDGDVPLGRVATVSRARKKASTMVRYEGQPAVLLSIIKKDDANNIKLLDELNSYIEQQNKRLNPSGLELVLVDDQTIPTRNALSIMENNALIGLSMVLLVAWLFLGWRIAMVTAIAIPFILAATFWLLDYTGETLNVTVLLGVVIVLGMLVDDAVVVVEAIHYRIMRGMTALNASLNAIKEVAIPVTTAVLTTCAAFMPLMLLPGILGEFMRVIPMVVTLALLISLVEAFWMLPAHVSNMHFSTKRGWGERIRYRVTRWIQLKYGKLLTKCIRHPILVITTFFLMTIGSAALLALGFIKVDFFASDNLRLYYVNVEMPSSTPLSRTMAKTLEVEQQALKHLRPIDKRATVSYAGMMLTQTEPLFGENFGQVIVSLNPTQSGAAGVKELIEAMREDVQNVSGVKNISFLELAGGPPASAPINVKVRGDDYQELRRATDVVQEILRSHPAISDVRDDANPGRSEMRLTLDHAAIRESGISPTTVMRTIQLLVDGEVVASVQDGGEKVEVRVRPQQREDQTVQELLRQRLPTPSGGSMPLSELVHANLGAALGNIRHYNFRRAITVEADLVERPEADFKTCTWQPLINKADPDYEKCPMQTIQANNMLKAEWDKRSAEFPSINLDFTGQLDDIQESMSAMGLLFLVGIGVMYLILGTQFKSYWQPLLILLTVLMAFNGVIYGIALTRNPLSLYTLYGIVALAGMAVNASIVLISGINDRRNKGMRVLTATIYAARRRIIPIMITTFTTIAGLFSLAAGLGGKSLVWGPVANSIVWGVAFSSVLTLIVVPVMYRVFNRRKQKAFKLKRNTI